MSNFDVIRFQFGNIPAEQKLLILRVEAKRRLTPIHGFGKIIQSTVGEPKILDISPELANWCAIVVKNTELLFDLIDGIISPQHRENRGMPELRPYDSLIDAIRQTAQKLDLPLGIAIDDTSKLFIHAQYPLVLLDEPKYHREIVFSLVESGYSVELRSFVDQRSFEVEYQVSPPSLDDVATIINQWLLEQHTLGEMQKAYPLPSSGD